MLKPVLTKQDLRIALAFRGASHFSGAENYYINLAIALNRLACELIIVDIPTSVIPKRLHELGIPFKFVNFSLTAPVVFSQPVDCLVVPNYEIYNCRRFRINPDCRMVVIEMDKGFWGRKHKSILGPIGELFFRPWRQRLIDANGLCLIEQDSIRLAKTLGYHGLDTLIVIPIPVLSNARAKVRDLAPSHPLRFVSVGRSVPMKMNPVAHYFTSIHSLIPDATFTFITHDPILARHYLDEHGAGFVRCEGGCPPEELARRLDAEADCVVAMGTASLDAAALGIPTLVCDGSLEWPYPAHDLRWIFDCHDNLGDWVTHDNVPAYGVKLPAIISTLRTDYRRLSAESHDFVVRNHSLESCGRALLRAVTTSRLTVGYYRNDFLYRVSWRLVALRRGL